MENKILTIEEFLKYYNNSNKKVEKKYGTIDALAYIVKHSKDEELLKAMTELINEFIEFINVDGKLIISAPHMPDILADKLLEKQQRMKLQKQTEEENRYRKDKEVKMIIAKDIIERIK